MRMNNPVTQQAYPIPEHYRLCSFTDLHGMITDANDEFVEISGYSREALIGQPHNLLRHPDVPEQVFADMWRALQSGDTWSQVVKNRRQNGDHYWVMANAAPVFKDGQKVGYVSVRTPVPQLNTAEIEQIYRDIRSGKVMIRAGMLSPRWRNRLDRINPFSRLSLMGKVASIGVVTLLINVGILMLNEWQSAQEQMMKQMQIREELLLTQLEDKLQKKVDVGLSNAVTLAGDKALSDAFLAEDRGQMEALLKAKNQAYQGIDFKGLNFHIHTADGKSFFRSSAPTKFGDDLTSFRPTIVKIMRDKKPFSGFDLGKDGVLIRSFAPIVRDQQYLGSLELTAGVGSVSREFQKKDVSYLMLITPEAAAISDKLQANPKVSGYFIVNPSWFDQSVVDVFNTIDLNQLIANKIMKTDKHLFTFTHLTDLNDKVIGLHVIAEPISVVQGRMDELAQEMIASLIKMILLALTMIGFVAVFVWRSIIKPIDYVCEQVEKAQKNQDLSVRLQLQGAGEILDMAHAFNGLMQSMQVAIVDNNRVMKKVAEGDLTARITMAAQNDFAILKNYTNSSIEMVQNTMMEITKAMEHLGSANFSYQMQFEARGDFCRLISHVKNSMSMLKEAIGDINQVMSGMNQGNFSARVNAETKGDLLVMKSTVNTALSRLAMAVSEIEQTASALADRNLTRQISGQYQGDLARIQSAMNAALIALNRSFAEVGTQAHEVSESSSHVADANTDLSKHMQTQASILQETAAAMEELSSQVKNASESASDANRLAQNSIVEVRAGGQIMADAIRAMLEVQEVSSKITGIVALIDSIAFQTNLLALNAAVEAARAGEHGRGFAIVAGEVRGLAQKSAAAAKDIRQLIDVTADKIHVGTERVKVTETMISQLIDKFEQMVGLVNQISHNAQEQNIGIEQTTFAVGQIDQAIQHGTSLILENASLAQYLGGVAEKLDQLVMNFNFDQHAQVAEAVQSNAPRALVVDDNEPSRKLAAALVKAKGFAVDSAVSGNEAIAKFQANANYQVVLMDIMMSNGNGLEAIKRIRAISPQTKIIALTADKSLQEEVRQAGTHHFLVKPLTPQALNQFI